MATSFVPRRAFPTMEHLPRSYFLGHHRSTLTTIQRSLPTIDLIIECRDYRIPLTSANGLFAENLGGRPRLIVYTKTDLGKRRAKDNERLEDLLRDWNEPSPVAFYNHNDREGIHRIVEFLRLHAYYANTLIGTRLLVIGMPNVGKSSLLNALRKEGVGGGKAASTGSQPGITRKIPTRVKVIRGTESSEGVYLTDTPGVFMPYVPDSEAMLKLALCGSVKDGLIQPTTIADYLLYQMNLQSPYLYRRFSPPTNDVMELLEGVADRTGRLGKGGSLEIEAAAMWIIQQWRTGELGRFQLEEVTEESLERIRIAGGTSSRSLHQGRKAEKKSRLAAIEARQQKLLPG